MPKTESESGNKYNDVLLREIAEFHPERDMEVLRPGSKANDLLTGKRDKAWEESKYHLPDGMTLLEFFRGKRKNKNQKKKK